MRLGDDIDDYCSRCKFSSNHSVVSMLEEDIKKVRCRTCNTEHNYRHNKGSREISAQQAFDTLLAQAMGQQEKKPAARKSHKK